MQPKAILSACIADVVGLFQATAKEVFIASAYLRIQAVAEILSRLIDGRVEPGRLRVLTRALPMDIATGASDVESLHVLSTSHHPLLNIELRSDPRLHAKAYLIDECEGIITSANLTPSGLQTNIELGISLCSAELIPLFTAYFDPIWRAAEVVNDQILSDLRSRIRAIASNKTGGAGTPRFSGKGETRVNSNRPKYSKRSFARLPSRPQVSLDPDWRRLSTVGLDLENTITSPFLSTESVKQNWSNENLLRLNRQLTN